MSSLLTLVPKLSSKLGVDSSPHILKALEQDEEDILHLLQQVVASEADEKTVLQLKGGAAQQFMDMLRAVRFLGLKPVFH